MQKEALAVLGFFSQRQDAGTELLPPPPPFPDIEPQQKPKHVKEKARKEKTKIVLKQKEDVNDILSQALKPSPKEPEDFFSIDAPASSGETEVQDVGEILQAIQDAKQPQQKMSFWKKLFTIKKRVPLPPLPEAQPAQSVEAAGQSEEVPVGKEPLSPVQEVMQLANNARVQLENLDVRGAKETYVDIMKLYRMMTEEEQAQVYEIVRELYEERRAAEKMPRI